ncbi:MBL fold metallo-hydrolase [Thermorudis peleae]|uniref:MBL fold metallo-hydrolase n=1 Tax=Thermorudis peleae TaxID=1382356 RepID=UPI000ADF88B4|nr:MBL fold metallo-hydrolase [Thermorudis peleae]
MAPWPVEQAMQEAPVCVTCGTQYPPASAPATCPVCTDERQYIPPEGQRWTCLAAMQGQYQNRFTTLATQITEIMTEPAFGIGQRAFLIETEHGNVLWDLVAFIDEATIATIHARGGVRAIAISHPHYYTTMATWAAALEAPIVLAAADRAWVQYPSPWLQFFDETATLLPGLTVIRCGGHFPGASVLHWADGADGEGVLFSGDTLQVGADRCSVSVLYSYPNSIPVDPVTIGAIAARLEPYSFAQVYGAFGRHIVRDAKAAVLRSLARYIQHITDPTTNAR